jgi:hypothetical protein
VFGKNYGPHGFIDYVLEGYAGVHDTLNQPFFYNSNGTLKSISNPIVTGFGRFVNAANVVLATPIVIPSLIPDYMRPLIWASKAR